MNDDTLNTNEKQYEYELPYVNHESEKNILMTDLSNMNEILRIENMIDSEFLMIKFLIKNLMNESEKMV